MTEVIETSGRLRLMQKSDLPMVLAWRNHAEVRRYMYSQEKIGMDEHQRWFESASTAPGRFLLILEDAEAPRGYLNFQCDESGGAVWGFYLAPDAPKGTGRLLGRLALEYAFNVLDREKIWGEVLADNLASQKFHLLRGFELETLMPEKSVGDQTIRDVRRYVLTRSRWQAQQGKPE